MLSHNVRSKVPTSEKGIRLIIANDSIDTAKGDAGFTPFRAIMHEWYARGCSRKMKSALQANPLFKYF